MYITVTELELNFDKYLNLVEKEDIFITENGKVIAKMTNPNADKRALVDSLFGIIPADITLEEAREERLSKL